MRISATKLEAFRLYLSAEWMTFKRFTEQIKGVPPNPAEIERMNCGSALHKIFEHSEKYRGKDTAKYQIEGQDFMFSGLRKAWPLIPGNGISELKTVSEFNEVQLVAVIDHVCGLKGYEYKTTAKFNIAKYEESAQWKVLLHLFQLNEIEYQVYSIKTGETGTIITDINRFSVFRYPSLEADLTDLISQFLDFIHKYKLETYFERKSEVIECHTV